MVGKRHIVLKEEEKIKLMTNFLKGTTEVKKQ